MPNQLTMQDVRAQFPQYGDMNDQQLAQALHQKFYSDMPFDQFSQKIGYQYKAPDMAPPSGLAGPVGNVIENVASPFDALASMTAHTVMPVAGSIAASGARLAALATGHDPNAWAEGAHEYFEGPGAYHETTPGGEAARNDLAAAGGLVMKPFDAIDRAIPDSPGKETAEEVAGGLNDLAATVPALGELAAPARAAEGGMQVARGASEVGKEAGYTGLNSRADMKMPGPQAVTDKLIAPDAGVAPNTQLNVGAVRNARQVGPGRVRDQLQASMPGQLTADPTLQNDINSIGENGSQLPRAPDIDALKQHMAQQPNMTSAEAFQNVSAARARAALYYGMDPTTNADAAQLGDAYSKLADAYEDFIGRNIPVHSPVSKAQWEATRPAFAKSYLAEEALKGGEHFDPGVFARAAQRDPNVLTGGSRIVADTYNALPAGSDHVLARGIGSGIGAAGGALAEHLAGGGLGLGGASGAVIGSQVAPAIEAVMRRLFTRGNIGAAEAAPTNPRLSYFYNNERSRGPAPSGDLTPPPGNAGGPPPRQLSLGEMPQGEGPPPFTTGTGANPNAAAPRQRLGDIPYSEMLSHGVEQPGAPGLSVGPMGPAPAHGELDFEAPAEHMAGDLELAPDTGSLGNAMVAGRDYAAVKSQGVPDGTLARTAPPTPGTVDTIDYPSGAQHQASLRNVLRSQRGGPKQGDEPSLGDLVAGLHALAARMPPEAITAAQEVADNGSAPGAAGADSIEAEHRLAAERQNGNAPFLVTPEGTPAPLAHTVDAVDQSAPEGHLKVQVDPSDGKLKILDRGGMPPAIARGLLARFQALHGTPQ